MTQAKPFNPGMVNAYNPATSEPLPAYEQAMIDRRDRLLGPAYRLFYQKPLHIVRGDGVWLEDPEGNRYLDVYNNVTSVGHCHPRVVEAINTQNAILNTHTRYLHDTILNYAEDLLGTFPQHLRNVMFTCTGSEANDLAYRIAKDVTGGTGVIVTSLAYHGISDAVSQFSPSLGSYVPLGKHVRAITAPNSYRRNPETLADDFAADVQKAIVDMEENGIKLAAFYCDGIFSSDGVFADPPGFLAKAVDAVRKAGGLYVADEVQPGFGRLGHGLWGFSRHSVAPDMVTIGKPMGNGFPIAAVVMRPELIDNFGRNARYFNTFGGNPVACTAAQSVLNVIRDDKLVENANIVGAQMLSGMRKLAEKHEVLGNVRGAGLFVGVELVKSREAKEPDATSTTRLVNGLRKRRVLIGAAGPGANVLKIRPPLIFSSENVEMLVNSMDAVLTEMRNPT